MTKILFVTEKFCDGDPNKGLSNHFHNLFNTLKYTYLADYDNIFLDECRINEGISVDYKIFEYVNSKKPDVVIYSFLGDHPWNPTEQCLAYLSSIGVPQAFLWCDITYPWAEHRIQKVDAYADLHIMWDGAKLETVTQSDKFYYTWTPQDPGLFYYSNRIKKDIPISFLGSIGEHYQERASTLEYLKNKGLSILVAGGQREGKLKPQEYANLMQRSMITINFARSPKPVSDKYQCKGRVFEAAVCKTLLLESVPTHANKFFVPDEDYIPFCNKEDLFNKILDLLKNQDRVDFVAANGHKKYYNIYNNVAFWKGILNKICQISHSL